MTSPPPADPIRALIPVLAQAIEWIEDNADEDFEEGFARWDEDVYAYGLTDADRDRFAVYNNLREAKAALGARAEAEKGDGPTAQQAREMMSWGGEHGEP